MLETYFWIYPWDLVDEGIDDALDRLKGEAGVTGISIATTYHSIEQLRPHPGVSPRTFRSMGGAQFQPKSDLYAATRMRPVVASWLKKANPLQTIGQACEKRGLKMRAWTVCCHGQQLAQRYPHAAVKDVFGDAKSNWVCPINPDVREYLRCLAIDLDTNYPFDCVELERPQFDAKPHVHAHHKIGIQLSEVGHLLYNTCFCESCRQGAAEDGIDIDAAAAVARTFLEQRFSDQPLESTDVETFVAEHEPLAALYNWRCQKIASLVESIKQAVSCRVVVHRVGNRFLSGTDWSAIGPRCDGLLQHAGYPDRPEAIQALVRDVYDDTKRMDGIELGFNATTPPCPDSETFVKTVAQAAHLKIHAVDIYNYGMLPMERLEWVRRAVRYAHRETDV